MCCSIRWLLASWWGVAACCALTVSSSVVAHADELENPYRRAQVGDWAKYKHATRGGSLNYSSEETRTITAKDGKTVKLKRTLSLDVGVTKEYDETIDLTAAFTTATLLGYEEPPQFTIEKTDDGTEGVQVGEKKLEARWTFYSLDRGGPNAAEKQIWVAKEAPFDGIVMEKLSSSFSRSLHTTVMVDFGSAGITAKTSKKPGANDQQAEAQTYSNSLGQKFALIHKGEFDMGELLLSEFLSKSLEATTLEARLELLGRQPPKQPVFIRRDYWIGLHEVTIGQFRQFVKEMGYKTEAEKDGRGGTGLLASGKFGYGARFTWQEYGFPVTEDHPVANVSWNDSNAFCAWLSKKEGKRYRLPTEVEWEFACRGNTDTTYNCGGDPPDLAGHANVADQSLKRKTPGLPWALAHDDGYPYLAPVGEFKANAYGLHDMHGNVLEWCADRFSFYDSLKEFDLPKDKDIRYVMRGGNWFNDPKLAGSASRIGAEPDFRNSLTGFRTVMEVSH